jgi:methylenetetrahydrofolate dehydrogenase (NADP+)/methenyltetrahydrofolate cyclohydrolase
VIGRSNIVGRPVSILLSRNTNPEMHRYGLPLSYVQPERNLFAADIIVAALGRAEFLKADM